jgi:hypothetical protein
MRTRRLIALLAAGLLAALLVSVAREGAAFADVFFDSPADAAPAREGGTTGNPASPATDGDAGLVLMLPQPVTTTESPERPGDAVARSAPPVADDLDAGKSLGPLDGGTEYTGLSVGLRGGVALPGGQAKSTALADVVKYVVPIGVDVGYYLRPNLYVGAYFLYGFAGTSRSSQDACPSGTDTTCTAQSYKWGILAEYAFRHTRTWSPWVRGGIGMDVINLTATDSRGATSQSSSLFGFEWAVLSAGLDWKPGYFYGVGPFAELALGDYGKKDGIADPHFFATFGLRARTGLFVP